MVLRTTALVLAIVGHGLAHAAMETTLPVPLDGAGVARGVVLIRCATNVENLVRLSRGAVLDVGAANAAADIVLTVAHGLPDTPAAVLDLCLVHGVRGQPYAIDRVWLGGEQNGIAADWAVLVLKTRLDGDVGRLQAARASGAKLTRLAEERAPVRLLLRQAPPTDGDCQLFQAGPPYDEQLAYRCPLGLSGVPGLSGSPLLVGLAGRPLIIGIHVGWTLHAMEDGRLHIVSLGRPIDADIAAAIAAATAAARR